MNLLHYLTVPSAVSSLTPPHRLLINCPLVVQYLGLHLCARIIPLSGVNVVSYE
jgi:hypothetical protein